MRNRWGVDVQKGHWVRFHHPRGGVIEDRVQKVVRDSDPWVQMESGYTCSLDDVSLSLGPMTVGRGGVVRQNPDAVHVDIGSHNGGRDANPTPNLEHWAQASQREHVGPRGGKSKKPSPRLVQRRLKTHHQKMPGVWANPLVRVKVKSPAQRGKAAPDGRLTARRKTTDKAPAGFYANPMGKNERNADAVRYAELFGGPFQTLKAWSDHYIVQFKVPGDKHWTSASVFQTKSAAVSRVKRLAKDNPDWTWRLITPD